MPHVCTVMTEHDNIHAPQHTAMRWCDPVHELKYARSYERSSSNNFSSSNMKDEHFFGPFLVQKSAQPSYLTSNNCSSSNIRARTIGRNWKNSTNRVRTRVRLNGVGRTANPVQSNGQHRLFGGVAVVKRTASAV